jgi:hypothetical protein
MVRFRDISQFPQCYYRCDVSWTYLEHHIERQREHGSAALDLEPDFQRAHVWIPSQQIAYVEYVLRGGTSGKELYFNCPGWMNDFRGPYVIVDGKQRLEAVRAFLRGDIPAFGHYRGDYTDSPDILHVNFSWNIAAIDTRAEVLKWYLNFNSGGSVHTQAELDRVRELLEREIEPPRRKCRSTRR